MKWGKYLTVSERIQMQMQIEKDNSQMNDVEDHGQDTDDDG